MARRHERPTGHRAAVLPRPPQLTDDQGMQLLWRGRRVRRQRQRLRACVYLGQDDWAAAAA
eukprot:257115-Chlamydomonas_euryale.AAC.1